jgi:hypothetical protein
MLPVELRGDRGSSPLPLGAMGGTDDIVWWPLLETIVMLTGMGGM